MIKIRINRIHGEKGKYFMSFINPDTMRDLLYLEFDCVRCVQVVIDTLSYATTEEIDITNYAWRDWE